MARLPLAHQLCRSALRHNRRAATTAAAATAPPSSRMPSALFSSRLRSGGVGTAELRRRFAHSQANLPPLPVPALDATLEKYLRTLRPIATEEEMGQVTALVEDFRSSGVGDKLQQLLLAHAEGKDNWLTEWWVNTAYLEYRDSAVINVNPGVRLPYRNFANRLDWLTFCARLALGLVDFQRLLAAGELPVERLRDAPLDMSQYYGVLGTCRLARPQRDGQLAWDGRPSNYMTVAHGNQFYRVQLLREESAWEPLPLAHVVAQLVDIVDRQGGSSPPPAVPEGVGLLSAMQRDRWAEAKARLVAAAPSNAAAMAELERSAFLLCLDRALLTGPEWSRASQAERDAEACGNMLHGWGLSAGNSGNRFFDKTLQVIVSEDGVCGFHYEHSPAEGVAAIRIFDHVFDRMASEASPPSSLSAAELGDGSRLCRRLDFQPYRGIARDLADADAALQAHIDNLQITSLEFDAYGKDFVRAQCRLSPDAYFQVALQLAYYRLYQQHCATYESGSLRRFRLGRTDTIRSCTPESSRFCLLMIQDEAQAAAHAFRDACRAHSLLTAQAVSGQGIDRHLLGLRLIAQQHGLLPLHPLFQSALHQRASHFQLSTSQVPSETGATLCFGPVVPDGYGVCYNQLEDRFLVAITAYSDRRGTDSDRLAASLRDALLDIRDLLLLHGDPPAARL